MIKVVTTAAATAPAAAVSSAPAAIAAPDTACQRAGIGTLTAGDESLFIHPWC